MSAVVVVIGAELFELAVKIDRIPEKRVIPIYAPDRTDQPFDGSKARNRNSPHAGGARRLERPLMTSWANRRCNLPCGCKLIIA